MGLDFMKRTTKTFKRSWDRGREELKKPRLFDSEVPPATRIISASPVGDHCAIDLGKEYVLRSLPENQIGVYASRSLVATGTPPPQVLAAINNGGGVALGVVIACHPLSGSIDVEIR